MQENNITYVFLLGFPSLYNFKSLFFSLLLIIYFVTLSGNVLIIILVIMNRSLHSPMYFFITQVSLLDILMAMTIIPHFLHIILHERGILSLSACISQLYMFGNVETSECLILLVMSYDRYVAICNPLQYNSIINNLFCVTSVTASWLLSFLMMLVNEIATRKLYFCGPNDIDHFFCDLAPIIKISCSDTSTLQIQKLANGVIAVICPFTMIIVSYVYIIITILNMKSIGGRQKAFSTCSSHLTAMLLFYGSLFSVYTVPSQTNFLGIKKALALLYTVVMPLLNPIIYSLRNKDFKKAFDKHKHAIIQSIYECSILHFICTKRK